MAPVRSTSYTYPEHHLRRSPRHIESRQSPSRGVVLSASRKLVRGNGWSRQPGVALELGNMGVGHQDAAFDDKAGGVTEGERKGERKKPVIAVPNSYNRVMTATVAVIAIKMTVAVANSDGKRRRPNLSSEKI